MGKSIEVLLGIFMVTGFTAIVIYWAFGITLWVIDQRKARSENRKLKTHRERSLAEQRRLEHLPISATEVERIGLQKDYQIVERALPDIFVRLRETGTTGSGYTQVRIPSLTRRQQLLLSERMRSTGWKTVEIDGSRMCLSMKSVDTALGPYDMHSIDSDDQRAVQAIVETVNRQMDIQTSDVGTRLCTVIFNADLTAAMKDAIIKIYREAGWDKVSIDLWSNSSFQLAYVHRQYILRVVKYREVNRNCRRKEKGGVKS